MSEQKINKTIKRNVLLNPGPATTSARVKDALVVADICPREKEFGDLIERVKTGLVEIVNGGDQYAAVLLGGSGTGAVESCLTSVLSKDKKVLIIENGAYGKRMKEICTAFSIPYIGLDYEWGDAVDLNELEDTLKSHQGSVNAIAYIHHETTVGILNPLKEIQAMAQKYQLTTIVDAMSSYAGIEIDLSQTPVDYLLSSSNKSIQGMAGLGFVIAKRTSLETLKDKKTDNYYFNLYKNFISQERGGQFLFTPPVQILYSLEEAINELKEEGYQNRVKRYASLYERMYVGMLELGFKPLIEDKKHHAKILTAFVEPNGFDFNDYHDYLYERGITVYPGKGAKEKTFRISNLGELNEADIDLFLKHTKGYLSK
jgi:2-aminoethylphosphonate aminotransferase